MIVLTTRPLLHALALISSLTLLSNQMPTVVAARTPHGVVSEYVLGLTKGNLAPFFSHNYMFRLAVAQIRKQNPQMLWQEREHALRSEIQRSLASSIGRIELRWGAVQAFDFLYEPAAAVAASAVEVRQGARERIRLESPLDLDVTAQSWEAFVVVRYPAQDRAPRYPGLPDSPKVKEAVLRMSIVELGPEVERLGLAGFNLDYHTEIVEGTLKTWPFIITSLAKDGARSMIERAIVPSPSGLGWERNRIPKAQMYDYIYFPGDNGSLGQVLAVLKEFGFSWDTPKPAPTPLYGRPRPSLIINNIVHPPSWKQYELHRTASGPGGLGYRGRITYVSAPNVEVRTEEALIEGRAARVRYNFRWIGNQVFEFYRKLSEIRGPFRIEGVTYQDASGLVFDTFHLMGDHRFIGVWSPDQIAGFHWSPDRGWSLVQLSGR